MRAMGGRTAAVGLLIIALATGCTPATPAAPPTSAPSTSTYGTSASPAATPSATTATPSATVPSGDAEADQAYFDTTNSALLASDEAAGARDFAENLVAAGFPAADIAFSADETPTGLDREAIEFAVRDGENCLVGQLGPSGYRSIVVAPIATGACLVGDPRTLD